MEMIKWGKGLNGPQLELGSCLSEYVLVLGFCENGNEPSTVS
jgi:hypothetical protein